MFLICIGQGNFFVLFAWAMQILFDFCMGNENSFNFFALLMQVFFYFFGLGMQIVLIFLHRRCKFFLIFVLAGLVERILTWSGPFYVFEPSPDQFFGLYLENGALKPSSS